MLLYSSTFAFFFLNTKIQDGSVLSKFFFTISFLELINILYFSCLAMCFCSEIFFCHHLYSSCHSGFLKLCFRGFIILIVFMTCVWSLGWEDSLEKGKATHSSILAWRIPWTVSSIGLQRVGHDWATFTFTYQFWKHRRKEILNFLFLNQLLRTIQHQQRKMLRAFSLEPVTNVFDKRQWIHGTGL